MSSYLTQDISNTNLRMSSYILEDKRVRDLLYPQRSNKN